MERRVNRQKASATESANRSVGKVGNVRPVSRPDEHVILPFPQARKGRGAVTNIQGRYEVNGRERFDDGWTVPGLKDEQPAALKTTVTDEIAKSILSRNTSPDIPFSVSLNP